MKFRKKPVVIEAIEIKVDNADDLAEFTGRDSRVAEVMVAEYDGDNPRVTHVFIYILEGIMRGEIGDWVIRGVEGEFYLCKPDIFAATYESEDATESKPGPEDK